jgi:hypothetical protein
LYDQGQQELYDQLKFTAQVHGAEWKDSPGSNKNTNETVSSSSSEQSFIFGSPDTYASLSKEEREELTQRMMQKHKKWVGTTALDK